MASAISEAINHSRNLGYELNSFLYGDISTRNKVLRSDITLEECIAKLEKIREGAWENYDDWAHEMGWK